jgi:hypothetical protein
MKGPPRVAPTASGCRLGGDVMSSPGGIPLHCMRIPPPMRGLLAGGDLLVQFLLRFRMIRNRCRRVADRLRIGQGQASAVGWAGFIAPSYQKSASGSCL